jgi:peptidoglycan hydrolase-like protein with peptidoglycan-binding domain
VPPPGPYPLTVDKGLVTQSWFTRRGGLFRRRRALLGVLAALVLLLIAFGLLLVGMAGATLTTDPNALARIDVQAFGGSVEAVRVVGPRGARIPVSEHAGALIPKSRLAPGERVSIEVTVRRPGWLGWLAGELTHEHLTVRTPVAKVTRRWMTVRSGPPRVSFDTAVRAVAYGVAGHLHSEGFSRPQRSFSLGPPVLPGTVLVASAARSWERLGRPQAVTWFPAGDPASVAAEPPPGSAVSPAAALRLTFSEPVSRALGSALPTLTPPVSGRWHRVDSHTLLFTPEGSGAGLATRVSAELPRRADLVRPDGSLQGTRTISWTVPPGSTLRLQQLLAEAGYMPVAWKPRGSPVLRTPSAEVRAAVEPPPGSFSWRYPHTPPQLRADWSVGRPNAITKGAVMAFERDNGMEADGVAGGEVWRALLHDAIAGKRNAESGYSYVLVSETVPETVKLWHNGRTVLSAPANTGIPGAETALGTYPVFEHLEETTMSGKNPDGSHYEDPGIKWVSYFNGGDALHAFNRASFGTPQNLGCVEMQLEDAAKVWPYTPIGTLVTVVP